MVPTSSIGFLAPEAYNLRNHICMIPCGGLSEHDPVYWRAEQLQYYAGYMINGQPIDLMFGGFIFNGIRARKNHFIYPLYVGFGQPSEKEDWKTWIDVLFTPNTNLHALYNVAGSTPLDVWISLPYPHPFQRSFGKINGRKLDFKEDEDRFQAIEWWLDAFIGRWNENAHLHQKLKLRGFMWQRESIDTSEEALVKRVNGAIKQRNYFSLWLPNYGSLGVLNWHSFGFDLAALNTNYYGNTSYDYNWIINASAFAKTFHTGMQIIFGKGLIYSQTHQLDYFNLGARHGFMKDSFLVYQFPNQDLVGIYKERFVDYIRLYTFIKGLYKEIDYPGKLY